MRITPTFPASSGKLAGFVASPGKGGTKLHAHTPRTNPRTVSQQTNRAIVGAVAQAWRGLNDTERFTWITLQHMLESTATQQDTPPPGAFNLFMLCNRRALTLGAQQVMRSAPPIRSIPPIYSFEVLPVYSTPEMPRVLTGFNLQAAIPAINDFAYIVKATAPMSAGRSHTRQSELKILAAVFAGTPDETTAYSDWQAVFGTLPTNGSITWSLTCADPISGLAGPSIRAASPFLQVGGTNPTPGSVTISFNSSDQAVLADTVIYIDGVPLAN